MSAATRAPARPDQACADAVELARAAAVETAGASSVGEHRGVSVDGERVVTHAFACLDRGYVGWHWAVTVARASRSREVTIDEIVLLPGDGAVLAPEWLPWSDRLRPGDLGVGDLLPTPADDERLVPAYSATDDADAEEIAFELGLGRVRVLSPIGKDDAVDRWYSGDRGPEAPIAKAAPARCGSCGFYLRLAGALRPVFGVCANEFAPDDGRVVSVDHGCGAHSEAVVTGPAPEPVGTVVDDFSFELVRPPGSVDGGPADEEFGHS